MTDPLEPAIDEAWAYRARQHDPLVQVVIVRLGVKKPRRVLVRFVGDAFEGLQDWVPPSRLKVPWGSVDEFVAKERRWETLMTLSPDYDTPEETAASVVFDLLILKDLATLGWNAARGVALIHDVSGLSSFLAMDPAELRAEPTSFNEDGDLVSPWPVTIAVARRAAERDPHTILRHVEQEEADALREATYGRWYRRRGNQDDHIPPEICASVDEEHGRPVRALLRQWCGADMVELRAELAALSAGGREGGNGRASRRGAAASTWPFARCQSAQARACGASPRGSTASMRWV